VYHCRKHIWRVTQRKIQLAVDARQSQLIVDASPTLAPCSLENLKWIRFGEDYPVKWEMSEKNTQRRLFCCCFKTLVDRQKAIVRPQSNIFFESKTSDIKKSSRMVNFNSSWLGFCPCHHCLGSCLESFAISTSCPSAFVRLHEVCNARIHLQLS